MTDDRHRVVRVIVGAMVCAAAGCSRTNHRIPDGFPPKPPEMYQPFVGGTGLPEASVSRPPYRLAVGDVIEVIYHVKKVPTPGGYRMKSEDVIRPRFAVADASVEVDWRAAGAAVRQHRTVPVREGTFAFGETGEPGRYVVRTSEREFRTTVNLFDRSESDLSMPEPPATPSDGPFRRRQPTDH